jgi:signal transduction histidine kinase
MRLACVALLLLLPFCASAQGNAQSFGRLEALVGKQFIDTANALPYDEVVAHLDESLTVFTKALRYATELGYTQGKAETHRWLAIVTYLKGQNERSVVHNQEAIRLFQSLGWKAKEGDQYCSLGFQMKARDLPRASNYMLKGMRMLEAEGDSGRLTAVYDNYGVIKLLAKDLDSSLFYYNRALNLKRLFADSLGIPFSLNKLGEVHLLRKNLVAARQVIDEAYRIRLLRKDAFGIMENYACFGDYFLAATQSDSAIFWYNLALDQSRAQAYPFMTRYCFAQLSKAYELGGNLLFALQMHRAYAAITDSLQTDQRTRQVTELELRFETLEKDRENSLLRQQKTEQQLVVSRQRVWMVALASATFTILLLAFFVLQRNKQREAAKRDTAIILERERGLRAIILATEEERKRIAKDLHDGIVQTLTGLNFMLQRPQQHDQAQSQQLLNAAIAEIRDISHRMMPRALAELGLVPSMADMLEKSLGAAGIHFTLDQRGMEGQRFDEALEIGLYRIAQELVNNILKHAKATEVGVQVMRSASHILLMVEDNGVGMASSKTEKSGIGLTNIRSRVSMLNGEVSFEPGPRNGTVVMVRVPV